MTQKEKVLNYLQSHPEASNFEMMVNIGMTDVRKCISDLRKDGYIITDRDVKPAEKGKSNYKKYKLVG